jgi:hypothetical protein
MYQKFAANVEISQKCLYLQIEKVEEYINKIKTLVEPK